MSEFWQTTLSTIQRGEPEWQAIASYEGPIRRYLARRYARLPRAERDDLLQEILIAMREKVIPGYRADVGSFRSFLAISIRNVVLDHHRRQRPNLDVAVHDPATDEGEADLDAETIDLEARLLAAVRSVHDHYARGGAADLGAVYVLSGALVHKLSNRQIAAREGLSLDQVKRKLQQVRAEILTHLFAGLLPDLPQSEALRCAGLARQCLRTPRKEARLLADEAHAELVATFAAAVRNAPRVLGGGSEEDLDLVAGMHAIFQ